MLFCVVDKKVILNLRLKPETRDDFSIVAELRGASMSGLLHQFIVRSIREEKELVLAEGQLPFPLKDFRRRWKKVLISAGLNKPTGRRGENFTFHDLRHEFASELIRQNVNPHIIQKLFAHSDMSITSVYMNSDLEQMKEAINTLDDATNLQPTEIETDFPN